MPRGASSISSMISQARIFGAPDRVPAGSRASTAEQPSQSGRMSPSTWEQMCMIREYRWIIWYSVTSTVPNRAIRPISFRPRSTSILCSASSFSSAKSSRSSSRSSSSVPPLGRDPATGKVVSRPSCSRTRVSGEALIISCPSIPINTM